MIKARFYYVIIFLISVFTLFIPLSVHADNSQTNFTISPSPIPWFEFDKGQTDLKIGADYVSVSGEDISLKGGGVLTFWRHAFTGIFALDAGISNMYLKGDVAGNDMSFISTNIPADLEFQVLHTDRIVMLLFGGVNLGVMNGYMSIKYPGGDADVTMTTYTYGLVAGAQASIKISDFALSPFFLFQRVTGKTETNITYSDRSADSTSAKMPAYLSKTFGFDIIYKPWGIVLSSMLQMLPSIGDNPKIKTYVFTLSKDFQFGVNRNTEAEPAKEEDKPGL